MFIELSNISFNQSEIDLPECVMTSKKRHESLERLLSIAAQRGIVGPSALASAMGHSEQVITNWGRRGVSKAGAMKAEEKFGCSAVQIMKGDDAPIMALPGSQSTSVSALLSSLSANAITLGLAFDKVPDEIQDRLHTVLTDYIAQAKRDFLLRGKHPEFHQPGTPVGVSQIPAASNNAPSTPAGSRGSQSKSRSR